MNSLNEIKRMNEIAATRKSQARARALNCPGPNPKDAEKGRPCKQEEPYENPYLETSPDGRRYVGNAD